MDERDLQGVVHADLAVGLTRRSMIVRHLPIWCVAGSFVFGSNITKTSW